MSSLVPIHGSNSFTASGVPVGIATDFVRLRFPSGAGLAYLDHMLSVADGNLKPKVDCVDSDRNGPATAMNEAEWAPA